jgi:hypothetical protein
MTRHAVLWLLIGLSALALVAKAQAADGSTLRVRLQSHDLQPSAIPAAKALHQ